jgi:hypothetical protein
MWSYVLAAIGVTGIFFVGRKTIWGWLILCLNAAIAYGIVYVKSYLLWRREAEKVSSKDE